MPDDPDIVKELREAEQHGKLSYKTTGKRVENHVVSKMKLRSKDEEELDDLWFSFWNIL
jgi:hypothetical protein